MSKRALIFVLILLGGADCLGNGLHYFISGQSYLNSELRNAAVIGQIIFSLAVLIYGVWYYKTSAAVRKVER